MSQTLNGNVKNCYRKKKVKNNGTYSTFLHILLFTMGHTALILNKLVQRLGYQYVSNR